jgi:hypothetical protein
MGHSEYRIGDIVFWATASAAGEYTVIGHPKGEPNVLVFEGGGEVDAEDCQPTGPAGSEVLGNTGSDTCRNS